MIKVLNTTLYRMLVLLLACSFFANEVSAQFQPKKDTVILEGFISTDKTLTSSVVHLIKHNVKIGSNATLNVERNTTVLFAPQTSLVVEGGLIIKGGPNTFVQIASHHERNQGLGILVKGGNQRDIEIEYAKFTTLELPLKFDVEWYRPKVKIENNIFTELYTGESNILITSPLISFDSDQEQTISFLFNNNSFVNNWGAIFIENLQDNILDFQFSNNLITNNVVYGIDKGIPSNTPVFGLFDDLESQFQANITGNSIFNNYQINSSTDTIIREISFGIQGEGEVLNIPNNFFRSKDLKYISSTFDHFYQNSELPLLRAEPFLTIPKEEVHPHIWKVSINGNEVPYYGKIPQMERRDVEFEVQFNSPVVAYDVTQLEAISYDTITNQLKTRQIPLTRPSWSGDKKIYSFTVSNAGFLSNPLGYIVLTNFKNKDGFEVPDFPIGQEEAINNYTKFDNINIRSADLISSAGNSSMLSGSGYLPDQRSVKNLESITDYADIAFLKPYKSLAKTWEVGFTMGASNYMGTLTYKLINRDETHFAFGLYGQYNAHKWFSVRAMLWYGRISGRDATDPDPPRSQRLLNFRNDIIEGSLTFHWHLLKYGTSRGEKFTPTIFAGIALFRNNPMSQVFHHNNELGEPVYLTIDDNGNFRYDGSGDDFWVPLQPIGTEGQTTGKIDPEGGPESNSVYRDIIGERDAAKQYKKVQVSFPIGFGVDVILYNSWTIGAELGVRLTATKYLDDAGQYYYDRGYKGFDQYGLPIDAHASIIEANPEITIKVQGQGKTSIPGDQMVEFNMGDGGVASIPITALVANPSLANIVNGSGINWAYNHPDARKGGDRFDHYAYVGFKVSKIIDRNDKKDKVTDDYVKEAKIKDADKDGLSNDYEKEIGTNHKNPDTDGDGLNDGEEVNTIGSDPLNVDTDGDGLNDGREVNEIGTSPINPDTDGDGLNDGREKKLTGTDPLDPDTDKGGVNDGQEVTTDQTNPVDGSDDKLDSDGDGIYDSNDECPQVKGISRFNGCPDSDEDGIPDRADDCPRVPGVRSNNGCPERTEEEVQEEVEEDLQKLFKNIEFDTNRDVIRSISFNDLNTASDILRDHPEYNVIIEGHTDNVGSDVFNKTLSQQRSEAVKRYLISKGISSTRIVAVGYGEERPKTSNDTELGRQTNRRVEINLVKPY